MKRLEKKGRGFWVAIVLLVGALSAKAEVERVVVFSDRAEVTRVQEVVCQNKSAKVSFENLPLSLDERTLRAETESGAKAVGVNAKTRRLEESLDARVREVQKELRRVERALNTKNKEQQDALESVTSAQSYWQYFLVSAGEEMRSANPDIKRWDAMLNMIEAQTKAFDEGALLRRQQTRKLQDQRLRLLARLRLLNPQQVADVLDAEVSLTCNKKSRVRLSYVVPSAHWIPEYDLRFSENKKQNLTLKVSARVIQSTGEDWENAQVWLSTASPRLGGEAPQPYPIWLDGHEVKKAKTLVQAQEKRERSLNDAKAPSGASSSLVQIDDGGKAFVLKIKERVSVYADSRPYWFPIDTMKTQGKMSLVAVPKLSSHAYQVVQTQNPAPYPLLKGKTHIYRGGTYMGDVINDYRAPGERFELSLGLDDSVRVERIDLLDRKSKGFLSSKKKIVQAYRVRLENRSGDNKTIEIREQIPVSKIEDVVVTMNKKTSAGYELDKTRGLLTWRVPLKARAKDKRDLRFTIELPDSWSTQ